uniref:glutathione transferase n=1 Tax=Mantoniella antarctica TaxID=81844 RepID=A0A7S0S7X4_9CHLO
MSPSEDKKPTIEIGYWKIRGLAAPMRMMACYAGVDFKDATCECIADGEGGFDTSSWFGPNGTDGPKAALLQQNPLINLPYVVDHARGIVIAQSNACLQYLARQLGLYGGASDGANTDKAAAECDQILCQVMDLRNAAVGWYYGSGSRAGYESSADGHLACVKVHYTKLEAWLAHKQRLGEGGTFFVMQTTPAVPDFHVWEQIDQHEAACKDLGRASLLADFPLLAAFHCAFRKLPELAAYFDSPASTFPINNPQAAFY